MEQRRKRRRKKKRKSGVLSMILLAAALIVFAFSAIQVVRLLLPYFQGGAEYDDLKEMAVRTEGGSDAVFAVDFDRLKEINPDTVAWIRFDEPEVISYPVVQAEDNQTYLTKTFQANDNKLGAIFMDCGNSPDFSDQNTLIYGHNLKVGGEMFSRLKDYESQEFYEQHPYFYIYTPDQKARTYRIFSAGVVKETAKNYEKGPMTKEEFREYLKAVRSSSAYDTGAEVTEDSRIVSLSTCTNVRDDERFLVQGVLVEETTLPSGGE